jgi:hypothetical protein
MKTKIWALRIFDNPRMENYMMTANNSGLAFFVLGEVPIVETESDVTQVTLRRDA